MRCCVFSPGIEWRASTVCGSLGAASTRDVNPRTTLQFGHQLVADIFDGIVILPPEAAHAQTSGQKLTPAMVVAAPKVVELMLQGLARKGHPASQPLKQQG